jgi:isocitrate/isopropylmalate dehydrogenase
LTVPSARICLCSVSDGEFIVNSAAAKEHRGVLEAINAGSAPKLSGRGMAETNLASHYSPTLNISVSGQKDGKALAAQIASHVNTALSSNKPDAFRSSPGQRAAAHAATASRASAKHN